MKTRTLALLTGLAVLSSLVRLPAAGPPKKLLVVSVTTGYRHSSIATGEKILTQLADRTRAFTVDFVRQPTGKPDALKPNSPAEQQAAFTAAQAAWESQLKQALAKLAPDSLKNYDGVIFLNTTGDLPIPDKEGFLAWLKSGKAFIGMHAATDTFPGWPEYNEMTGAHFLKHGPQVGVECLNQDPKHPATAHLPATWTISQEEIYQFKDYDPARVHELLVLDKHPNDKSPGHYAVAWCRDYGKGKVFYTSLGHREDIWDTDANIKDRKNSVDVSKAYQAHILGGIEWALGLNTSPK